MKSGTNYSQEYGRAERAYLQGDFNLAAKIIDSLVQEFPENPNVLLLWGHIYYYGFQDYDLAREIYEAVLVLSEEQKLIDFANNHLKKVNQSQQQSENLVPFEKKSFKREKEKTINMAQVDKNKNVVVTQEFIDKLIDKIGKTLKEQHTLVERDEEQEESIELLLEKVSSIENNLEELTKSLAKGSYPLKLARSIQVAPSSIKPHIVPVDLTKAQLIATYNELVAVLSGYIIPVTLTPDSYRGSNSDGIILETTIKGNYWAIATLEDKQHKYWLVPNNNISFNIHKLKTVENLFQLKGDYNSPGSEFILQEPAILSLLPDNKQWKLIQPGILFFGSIKSASPQLKQPEKVVDDKQSKVNKQILSSLTAFKTTIDKLNSKISQLEIQSEILDKVHQRDKQEWLAEKQVFNEQLQKNAASQSQLNNFINQSDRTKTNHIFKLIESYNQDKNSISDKVKAMVRETEASLNQRRSGNSDTVTLENTTQKKFWIIEEDNNYYLILHAKINIDEYNRAILESLFDCTNFTLEYSDFQLIQPAKVFQLSSETWQLDKKGKIEFISNTQSKTDNIKTNDSQDTKIDLKTKISRFRQDYTQDIKLISDRIVAKVVISVETLLQLVIYKPDLIKLENTADGKYWIIDYLGVYFLIPSEIHQITNATEKSLNDAKILFDLVGYYPQYSSYHLIKPAIVTKLSANQWKLKEKGKFNFS